MDWRKNPTRELPGVRPVEDCSELGIYVGPFRDGSRCYGYRSKAEQEAEERRYYQDIRGGGLYDHREDPPVNEHRKHPKLKDQDAILLWFELFGSELPLREQEVVLLYWKARLSRQEVAREMGLKLKTIEEYIRRIRGRYSKVAPLQNLG